MQYSIVAFLESLYLVRSNKNKCRKLLSKPDLALEDIVDIYIGLHMVLEVSLNALHRQIITSQIVKPINKLEVIKNIDNIGFIEKTILFIYNSHFNFGNDIEESATHHKIIGKLINFSGIRNKLLHGHSIGSLMVDNHVSFVTETKKILNVENLKKQIKLFIDINDGLQFFLDHLDRGGRSESSINRLKKQYLDYCFIPKNFLIKIKGKVKEVESSG